MDAFQRCKSQWFSGVRSQLTEPFPSRLPSLPFSPQTDSQADVRADQAAKETGGAKELQKETAEYFNKEGKASEVSYCRPARWGLTDDAGEEGQVTCSSVLTQEETAGGS